MSWWYIQLNSDGVGFCEDFKYHMPKIVEFVNFRYIYLFIFIFIYNYVYIIYYYFS